MKLIVAAGLLAAVVQSQPPALRIVVLEGEGAVNIIQQKTAVRPLIEVRDRNNVPVAGATVTFTIGGGQPAAFAGGVQTLTVTTNAAGQAAAGGFNVLGTGAVQIQVQAAYQGQIATAAISQTNVATAAAAATLAGAAAGAAAAGGISATTIAIVGAAVAGGAVVATQAGRSNDDTTAVTTTPRINDPAPPAPTGPTPIADRVFTGPFSGQMIVTTTTTSDFTTTCTSTRAIVGTVKITLRGGDASGTLEIDGTRNEVAFTQSQFCQAIGATTLRAIGNVTGGPGAYTFTFESSGTSPTPNGGGTVTSTETTTFTGAMSGGVIAGTLSHTHVSRGTNNLGGVSSTIAGDGSTSMPVTLRP